MCCIVVAHTLHDCYSYMDSLQGRGRDAAGIAAIGESRIDVIKWKGLVKDFGLTDLHKIFPGHRYHTFIGHIRYATKGRKDKILHDAHPHVVGGTFYDNGSHILIEDCDLAIVENGQTDDEYFACIDKSKLSTGCDSEKKLHLYRQRGEVQMMQDIPGAFTLAIADKKRSNVVVMRDRTGIKPGVLGLKDGKYNVVSEDIALRKNGAKFIEDLTPGTVYYLSANGDYRKIKIVDPQLAYCFFEWNYIAHVDSIINGLSVLTLRKTLGQLMAMEHPLPHLDWISFVPRCPEVAGRSYADHMQLEFLYTLYKMKLERAFLGATAKERADSISSNLYLLPDALKYIKNTCGGIMEDSIVRGNNADYARRLFYAAKVKEMTMLSYTPPIGIVGKDGIPRGCMFGVDMPPTENLPDHQFIARNKTPEEISNEIGLPVRYLSVEGMLQGFELLGMSRENLCTYCIGGPHPFEKVS